MTRRLTLMTLALMGGGLAVAYAQGGGPRVRADLRAADEVPAISSPATGRFRAVIDERGERVAYEVSYANLEADVLMSHIHIAQPGVNGGIMVWLCQTPARPGPAGTPTCPGPRDGVVTGEFTAADVQAVGPQGIAPGEFAEVIRAIRDGIAYVNVHSETFPGGEIRGQVLPGQ
ncbi:MAG TPA: CHRD domain-containing protein [Vicinamibacterales bacterium]